MIMINRDKIEKDLNMFKQIRRTVKDGATH